MPSFWRRISDFISDRIREREGDETEDFEDEILPPEPPIEEPEEVEPDEVQSIYNIDGSYVDTQDWTGWWNITLLGSDRFANRYGGLLSTLTLIRLLEDAYDIDWPWDDWKEAYASVHGYAHHP